VSLSLANRDASLPIAYRLYLPEDWAKDQARRDKARVPETIAFQTKPEIAFEQIKAARATGLPEGVVLMDAGYGNDTGLRTDITALACATLAVDDRPKRAAKIAHMITSVALLDHQVVAR
jgi:SRSO17 transposase